jgi:hypothetical protein
MLISSVLLRRPLLLVDMSGIRMQVYRDVLMTMHEIPYAYACSRSRQVLPPGVNEHQQMRALETNMSDVVCQDMVHIHTHRCVGTFAVMNISYVKAYCVCYVLTKRRPVGNECCQGTLLPSSWLPACLTDCVCVLL